MKKKTSKTKDEKDSFTIFGGKVEFIGFNFKGKEEKKRFKEAVTKKILDEVDNDKHN